MRILKNNYNSKKLVFFKSQKWRKETWDVIHEVDKTTNLVSSKCPEVLNFINFTEDAFVYMIANQYINSNQYLFWYENKRFYNLLSKHFNKNMNFLIDDLDKSENGIIFFNLRDLSFLRKKINFVNFDYIEFPLLLSTEKKRINNFKKMLKKD